MKRYIMWLGGLLVLPFVLTGLGVVDTLLTGSGWFITFMKDILGILGEGSADYVAIYMMFVAPVLGVGAFVLYGLVLAGMAVSGYSKTVPNYLLWSGFLVFPLFIIGVGFLIPSTWEWI